MADVTSWLPNLLGPVNLQVNGVAVSVPKRLTINMIGAGLAIADNSSQNRTDFTFSQGITYTAGGNYLTVVVPETLNAGSGSTLCEASAKETTIHTTDSSAHAVDSYVLPNNSHVEIDVELVAIKDGHAISGTFKYARAFLNNNGTVTAGTQQTLMTPEFLGGSPSWTAAIANSGTTANVNVNSAGDAVQWYCIKSRVRVTAAA